MRKILAFALLLGLSGLCVAEQTKQDVDERLQSAAKVLDAVINAPDHGIPNEVLTGAKCVAVVPSMIKGGFIFGGRHGRGVATCRLANGRWSAPSFFTVTGGSWGAQIGVEDVQLVMMIMNDEGMRHLTEAKFQIGGEVSAAAGPFGREASAGTSWKMDTEILTYSRAKGVFAGADLGGTQVERDGDSTKAFYGKDLLTKTVLDGEVPPPPAAHVFLAAVAHSKGEAVAKKEARKDEKNAKKEADNDQQ
jgi:SH3 domain-containing YSC84-like protein 1